jgi:acyl dehydratase
VPRSDLHSIDTDSAPLLPRMGPGLVLRVLSKRAQAAPDGSVAPLHSQFTLPGLDQAHVARYRAALDFAPGTAVPLSYWYLPVQRAHMATLLSDAFPYRLAGIVHVENFLEAHAPLPPGAAVLLSTRIDILPPSGSGAVYCALETIGTANGERIFTCTSKYLAVRGARSGKSKGGQTVVQQGPVIDSWTLGPSSGRDYARISGDWNPIHLTRWSARLMGLPAPIIHGMHTLARTCAALETMADRPVASVSVRFTAPVPLGEAAVLTRGAAPERYVLFCAGVPAAEGAYTLA